MQNSYFNKIIQLKNTNTIAVQTESSESEYSNAVSKNTLKPVQNDKNSKRKQPNLVEIKENVIGHHQPGEIPKYVQYKFLF